MNLPLFLARRLSLGADGHKSSPAVKVATTAVALSVAVMMAAIAVVCGFKDEITRKVTGFNPHITIQNHPQVYPDDPLTSLTPSLKALLDSIPYVEDYTLTAAVPGILKTPSDFKGIYLKSAGGRHTGAFLESQLEEGSMPDMETDTTSILLSRMAATQLGLRTGDQVETYFMTDNVRVRRLRIAGIYNSHFDTYDDIYAYAPLPLIQDLGGVRRDQGTQIAISVDDFSRVAQYAQALEKTLAAAYDSGRIFRFYSVDTALSTGANYFSWLQLLDMNVVVVIALMAAVACVTLISGLLIIIVDKKRFIGVMKALGAPDSMISRTFVWLAVRVALTGLLLGDAISLLLLWVQKSTRAIPLDAENYYIDFVPVEFNWPAILTLNAAALVLTWVVLILPARFASTVK